MFKNAKVGDRVWFFEHGWGTIINIFYEKEYPIIFKSDTDKICNFRFDGRRDISDINPSLFWNEIKFEIPEKTFNLESELMQLGIKDFISNRENFYLEWDNNANKIRCGQKCYCQQPFEIYFEEKSIKNFIGNIKDKNITKEQFFKTYKKVFGGK